MPGKRRSQRGSILVFFMMAVPLMLVPLVGLGIDATMLRIVQARLGAAVDGAALGTGRLLGSTADPSAMAQEFVKANFLADGSVGFWGANNLQIAVTYTPGITKTVAVNATADVPLLFSRIFGQSKATVSAASTATRTDSRIMIVVDRSGSMTNASGSGDGHTAIFDAIAKAKQFTQSFTSGTDEAGLIVFDGSATMAYPAYAQGTYTTAIGITGGPDTGFMTPMVNDLTATGSNNGSTNTSEALWLAYVELQKAHMRDIQGGIKDTRLNAIVLLTDGIPQAVTIWPNNTGNASANCPGTGCPNYFLSSSTNCANRWTSANHNPRAMTAYVSVAASWGNTGSGVFSPSTPAMYQPATTDTTQTLNFWIGFAQSTPQGLTGSPLITSACSYLGPGDLPGNVTNDLPHIPTVDAYGNTMNGNAYQNSSFLYVNGTAMPRSNNPIYTGNSSNLLTTDPTNGNSWVQSAWNATDSAAARIRTDVNHTSRGEADKIPIFIYTIGYLHPEASNNAGIDSGLLARIANDQYQSSSYDSTSPAGQFIIATDAVAMAQAFDTIRAALLRLAK